MRTTKKILASVLAVCMLASTSIVSSFAAVSPDAVGTDTNYSKANEALDAAYAYDKGDLGATYTPQATTFKVWSPTATEVTLNRFATGSDNETGAAKLGNVSMEKLMEGDKWTGVWTTTVTGDIVNTYYTYTIKCTHPYTGAEQTAETQDINSVATGVNGRRSMVCDLSKTDPEGWSKDNHVLLDKTTDSTVWEVHVKDFSYDTKSGVSEKNRGKYLAFTETGTTLNNEGNVSTCIDYLKKLGVTTVQINPFYDFQSINEAGSSEQFNWGYDPQNYNVPEGSYSTNPYDGNVRIKECKQMIQALHNAGISVVMDVVYNHTFACGKDDSCFQATVPDYYYRMNSNGTFSSGSGCGNDVACERAMTRDFIVRSCRYWVDEYHVDGFRFDLMGLMDADTLNAIRDNLDQVDSRITMWGEGWSMGTNNATKTFEGKTYVAATQANAAKLSDRIGFFSDSVRDGIKGSVFDSSDPGFIGGIGKSAKYIRFGVQANTRDDSEGWVAKAPSQTVTYADCHDNMTLYDQIIAANKLGDYGVRNDKAMAINKLAAAIIYTSQGVSFTLAGQEMARSKDGDHNSYISPAPLNMIKWDSLVKYADLVSYYKGLMDIRKAFAPFTAADNSYKDAYTINGTVMTSDSTQVAFTVNNNTEGQWKKMAVLFNSGSKSTNIILKDKTVSDWVIIANDKEAGVKSLGELTGTKISVPASSAMILVDKKSFNQVALSSNTGRVEVKYEYLDGTPLAEPMILKGEIGDGYATDVSDAVPNTYELQEIKGNATGTFTEKDQTVTYVYTDFVPANLKNNGDINDDGETNIADVTAYQKWVADLVTYSDEKVAGMDFNCDGESNITDATMLQKYLAGIAVSTGTVEINYYFKQDDGTLKNIIDPVQISGRVGDPYTSEAYDLFGYEFDESGYPSNASGLIQYGPKVVVNYIYSKGNADVTLHVKHSGSLDWQPYLWIWGSDIKGKDTGNYSGGNWPGKPAIDDDNDGWYDYTFTFDVIGTFNIIVSKKGNPQTRDYKGFMEPEMWIVIDDSIVGKDNIDTNEWLTFYSENPDTNPNAPVVSYK